MRYTVLELRRRGVRLTADEMRQSTAVAGDLQLKDMPFNADKRPLRYAQVREMVSTQTRDLLVPLFEPQLIRMSERWFVLKGWQIEAENGVKTEYAQEWLASVPYPFRVEGGPELQEAVRALAQRFAAAVPDP